MASNGGKGKSKGLSGQALKDFRHSVAVLKRKGLVSKRVDARSQNATRYMRQKVRDLTPVIEGNAIAVKAPKAVRQQYKDSGVLDVKYNRVIAPKEFSNQRARLTRGMVQMVRPLKNGREEYVILPFKPTTANELLERLITDPSLDGLKDDTEFFSFRLYGHNSNEALFTAKEMGEYLQKYRVLQGRNSRDAIKHLTFQRFRHNADQSSDEPNPNESHEPKIVHKRADDTGRNSGRRKERGTYARQLRAKNATRVAKQRASETPAKREKRLAAERIRSAQRRQWIFENS